MKYSQEAMENKNAFKHWINQDTVEIIAQSIRQHHPSFDSKEFSKIAPSLKSLELKARVLEITKALREHLPQDYQQTVKILINVIKTSDLKGFNLWPFSEYISQFGTQHFDHSLKAMEILTEKFTAEFAVRPFLLKNSDSVLKFLSTRTAHSNVHIRRWVSEGTRPYLPWGQKIPQIAQNPQLTLKLLDKLKYDDELYVRKSIANHLNDHSKLHSDLVVQTLKTWEEKAPEKQLPKINWIKRHALRTLIKKGHPKALQLMGVNNKIQINVGKITLSKKKYHVGDKLMFNFQIKSTSNKVQKLIVDYAIDFAKANGKKGMKVFKLKVLNLNPKEEITITKSHHLKKITTMRYYPGEHHLKIQINGNMVAQSAWDFQI